MFAVFNGNIIHITQKNIHSVSRCLVKTGKEEVREGGVTCGSSVFPEAIRGV